MIRRKLTTHRPYRCTQCGWRGWDSDTGPGSREYEFSPEVMATRSGESADPTTDSDGLSEFDISRVAGINAERIRRSDAASDAMMMQDWPKREAAYQPHHGGRRDAL